MEKARACRQAADDAVAKAKKESDQLVVALNKERDEAVARIKQFEIAAKKDADQIRTALERDRDAKLLKASVDHRREVENYQKTVTELQRKLERKTTGERGEGAEVEVFDALTRRV